MAISEYQNQKGVESYPYRVKKDSDISTLMAAFLFSSHPKRDREAHLNYYTSTNNMEREPSHRKTKLNHIR